MWRFQANLILAVFSHPISIHIIMKVVILYDIVILNYFKSYYYYL